MKLISTIKAIRWWNIKIAPKELNYANHKRKMINEAFNKIKIWNMVGAYLEFGVYRGQSIIFAYQEKEEIFGKLNSTQLNSTQLNSTQLNSTQRNHKDLCL